VDRNGRLVAADPPLAALHQNAGGLPGGTVAVPQIAMVARLAQRSNTLVARSVVAADGAEDVDLWVRAQPAGDAVDLAIVGWRRRPATPPFPARPAQRAQDFLRADAALDPSGPDPVTGGRGGEPEDAAAGAVSRLLDRALRVPLDRIIARAEQIRSRSDGPLRRDYAGYAEDIATAGRHLLALVDDLADLQIIEQPDLAAIRYPVDLADVARRAASLLSVRAGERNIAIERPGPAETLPALAVQRRTLQIAVNLIGNAVHYSPEGATVSVRCERQSGRAVLSVTDQGKGIADRDQQRIFEKFERVDPDEPGGTGLGLYIARRLARAMNGDLIVESAAGEGARFILTLPAADG
jgi:signal transduction histidine kinase